MNLPAPSFIDRAVAFVAPEYGINRITAKVALAQLSYDAANPGSLRGGSGGLQKNAHSENPTAQRDRIALMWDSRDLRRQMPVLNCAVTRLAQYVAGRIKYQAAVSDNPAVNSAYEHYFEHWCKHSADMTGRVDFRTIVELAFVSAFTDGDVGANLALNPFTGRLGVQLIQSDRIGDPRTVSANTSDDYTSGVHLDPNTGRVLGYDVFRRTKMNQYAKIGRFGPDQMRLIFLPELPDQVRGVTKFAPVLPQARDLYEMYSFERGAAKWAASIAGVVKSKDARTPGPGSVLNWTGTTTAGTPTQSVVPNKLLRLTDGEDVSVFNSNARPAGAFVNYIVTALKDIAMGMNLPYGFFDMSAFGGATARIETMQVQRVVERWQQVLETQFLDWVKNAVIDEAVALGALPPVRNPHLGRWNFGAHITADIGYQTAANLQMLAAGLTTRAKLAAEQGEDIEDIIAALANEIKIAQREATAKGVPIELIMPNLQGATKMLADIEAAKLPPPPPPSLVDAKGDVTAKAVSDIVAGVKDGRYEPDTAFIILTQIYGLPPAEAEALVASVTPPPAPPALSPVPGDKPEPVAE